MDACASSLRALINCKESARPVKSSRSPYHLQWLISRWNMAEHNSTVRFSFHMRKELIQCITSALSRYKTANHGSNSRVSKIQMVIQTVWNGYGIKLISMSKVRCAFRTGQKYNNFLCSNCNYIVAVAMSFWRIDFFSEMLSSVTSRLHQTLSRTFFQDQQPVDFLTRAD